MRKLAITAALAALAVPAVAGAASPNPSAEQTCRAQRTAIGATDFKSLYSGSSNAFGKCVSRISSSKAKNKQAAKGACTAEQTADLAGFNAKYGNGKKGANAYGKCVSGKSRTADAKTQQTTLSSAKSCKGDRRADPAAYNTAYGTKKNAFGKCVSAKSKAKNDAQPTTTP